LGRSEGHCDNRVSNSTSLEIGCYQASCTY
jgi:hypothetical protein